jgi:hypothetical protein
MHVGGCLCGAVRYRVEGPLAPIQLCHCGQCRKAQGSAFAANIPLAAEQFRLESGAEHLQTFRATPAKRRVFCGRCGSPIFSQRDAQPGALRLRAGTLDGPVAARPGLHIQAASKADWWTITDTLPQHPGEGPG